MEAVAVGKTKEESQVRARRVVQLAAARGCRCLCRVGFGGFVLGHSGIVANFNIHIGMLRSDC